MKPVFRNTLNEALRIMGPSYLKKEYRNLWTPEVPVIGYCYVVSEAIYYIMKSKGKQLYPHVMRVFPDRSEYTGSPGETLHGTVYDTHWYLLNESGSIIDYTSNQYDFELKYGTGKRCGFLTKNPSRRGKELIKLLHSLSGKLYEEVTDADPHGG